MYTDFYGLTREPFQTTCDTAFLFPSSGLNEALAIIEYGIKHRTPIAITGEAGVGKTMLVHAYLKRHVRDRKTIYIPDSSVSLDTLLNTILKELGIEPASCQVTEKIHQLEETLLAEHRNKREIVLIMDDAHTMHAETLESIRMFSSSILVGRPELNELLGDQIALRVRMERLTKVESLAYIQRRLTIASQQPTIFSKQALDLIVKAASGIPRQLNILCENALITGFRHQQPVISGRIAKEVIADLNGHPSQVMWKLKPRHAVVMVSLALPIIVYASLPSTDETGSTPEPSTVAEPPAEQEKEVQTQAPVKESNARAQADDLSLSDRMELSETARLLAVLLDSGRVVVGRAQATINNPRLEDKGFSSSVFEGQLRKEFMARTRHDLHNLAVAPIPETAKPLLLRLGFFMQKAVHDAQPLINKKGIGFKGFIPATFGTQVAELFSKDTGLKLRQIGPPGVAPRNPNNKPDEQEEQLLYAIRRNHPRVGDHMIENPEKSGVHVILPLFYNKQCLACHGSPKGEIDISGYEKEGFKDGDLGGAISITVPFPKKVAKGNE